MRVGVWRLVYGRVFVTNPLTFVLFWPNHQVGWFNWPAGLANLVVGPEQYVLYLYRSDLQVGSGVLHKCQ